MLRIAVTGGIACGKSEVGFCLADQGVAVLDADELAHELMAPGRKVHAAVVREFGDRFVRADGNIDREALAGLVFADEEARGRLNAIVHPLVAEEMQAWLASRACTAAVLVPLLFEADMACGWDAIVCVCASERLQRERLSRRGLDDREAGQRIGSQMPVSLKVRRSGYVIVNNGTREQLREQTRRVLRRILET